MKRIVKTGVIALCGAVAALSNVPAAFADSGIYFGGNAGYTLSSYSRHTIDGALESEFSAAGDALTINSSSLSKSTADWSAEVGYMFSPYVGIEASYWQLATIHYGESGTIPSGTGTGTSQTTFALSTHSRGPALTVRGVLPLSESWFVDAHLGAYDGHTHSSFTTTIDSASSAGAQSGTHTSALAAVGTGYVLASHWTVRADFVYISRIQDELLSRRFNVEQLTAGVTYTF